MPFEKFIRIQSYRSPFVSIWKRGGLHVNKTATEMYNLSEFKFAVLYYNKEERVIGVKFTHDASEEGAVAVTHAEDALILTLKVFLQHYNLIHKETKKYRVGYDNETHFLSIYLNKPM